LSVSSLGGSPPTPSSLEKRCRPAKDVLEETEVKGTLVERVESLEQRLNQVQSLNSKPVKKGRNEGRKGLIT
jgi:hypothetical protein